MRASAFSRVLFGSLLIFGCANDRSDNGTGAWVGDNDDDAPADDDDAPADDDDAPPEDDSNGSDDPPDDSGSEDPTLPLTTGSDDGSSSSGGEPVSPYAGGWPVGDCADDITPGSGIATDFTGLDQFGDTVRLYDFCNQAVIVHAATFT